MCVLNPKSKTPAGGKRLREHCSKKWLTANPFLEAILISLD